MSNNILDAVAESLGDVLKEQYTEKKRAEREKTVRVQPTPVRTYEWSVKEAVFKVMKQAASKASANFTLLFCKAALLPGAPFDSGLHQ